jgi:hypothetical protein
MKALNVIIAIIATLFTAGVAGSLLVGAIWFSIGLPVVAMLGVTFAVVTFGVGTVSIMEAIEE